MTQPHDPYQPLPRAGGVGPSAGPWGQGRGAGRTWAAPSGPPAGVPHDPYAQGPFGGQPQWAQQAMFPVPPRRRRNPLLQLLKAALLVVVLGFVGLVALGTWVVGQVTTPSAPTTPRPTSVATTPEVGPTEVPSGPPAPPGQYANDDYVVPPVDTVPPPLPEPETYKEATGLLRANPLYATSVPRPVRCEMGQLDLQAASRAQLTGHLNQMMGCLMRVWAPPLEQAGFTAVRPSVTVYQGAVSTHCGRMKGRNASYCSADQQVYYAADLPTVVPRSLRSSRFVTEAVIAHEFGHAVQARSAILVSEQAWEDKTSAKAGQLELSRRLEMQADCMAGQFLGSIATSTRMTPAELDNVTRLFRSIGDDELSGQPGYVGNHGQGADRQAWTTTGIGSTSVGACNTFTAPASTVR